MSISVILTLFAILVAVTNILVNVIKAIWEVKHPQRVVVAVAVLLAVIVAIAIGIYLQLAAWYLWAGLIVAALLLGTLVAYVAMYGYDQGYEDIVTLVQRLITYINGGGVKHE